MRRLMARWAEFRRRYKLAGELGALSGEIAMRECYPELAHPARVEMLKERRRQVRIELGVPPDLTH